MGLFGSIGKALGGVAKTVARGATSFIPGPIDDIIVDAGIGIAERALSGGGSQPQQQQQYTTQFRPQQGGGFPAPTSFGGGGFGGSGAGGSWDGPKKAEVVSSRSCDIGNMQDFGNALMMELFSKSVKSKSGRAIMQAIVSGSLQGGIVQCPERLETSYGEVRYEAPPGFRTVTVNGRKVAVFKPIAMSMGLLPKSPAPKITAADMKTLRRAETVGRRAKELAKKAGFKVTNR